jgi:hypothetical protein
MRDFDWPAMAKQTSAAGAWIEYPEHHPEAGRLARPVWAEDAGNAAFGNGQADAVDRAFAVELLYEVAGLGGDWSFPHALNG